MLRKRAKTLSSILLLSTAALTLAACDSNGSTRLAGIGNIPPTPVDGGDGSGGDGSGSGSGGAGSGAGNGGSGGGGSTGGGGTGSGGSGSGGTGGTGSAGGGGSSGGTTGSTSGALATLPVPGVVGPGGVADTGLLANTGNPSNPGALGPVLVAAGNAVLGVNGQTPTLVSAVDRAIPGSVPIAGTVSQVVGSTGQVLVDTGQGRTYLVDGLTAAVGQAVSLNVLDRNVLPGSGTPLVGASVLSATQGSGSLATVGVDAAGNLVKAVATPLGTDSSALVSAVVPGGSGGLGGAAGQVVGATAGGSQLLGTAGGTPLVGASVLSPTQTTGSLATVGVGSGGNVLNVAAGPVAGASAAGTASASGGVLPSNGLATVTVGNGTLLNGGSNPAVGASVLSPGQTTGSAVTAGVLSAGNVLTTTAGNLTAPLTGAAAGGTASGGASANPGGVTGLVGGLLNKGG